MTILPITTKVSKTSASADAGVAVGAITPVNDWTLWLKVWSFTSVSYGTNRARIVFEDATSNSFSPVYQGPSRCIVPVNGVPEGRIYTTRWRDFDDLFVGVSGCYLRTNLIRITAGTIVYESWLTY